MIRYSLESLKYGMKIGKPIFDDDGKLVLGRGLILNDFFISGLKNRGISSIFIQDDVTDDIIPVDNISEMVRGATIRHMREMFDSLEDINREMKDHSHLAVMNTFTSDKFQKTFRNHPAFQKIQGDSIRIVEELIEGELTLGLNSLKTYDNYTFQHSIDVAIVSIMIGRKIGFNKKRLRELGIGCILHDIGKIFIPLEIINKPSKLTPVEFEKIKNHPNIGYELIKDVPTIGVLPPHVALQHHEKQDGTGYPRGLCGDNSISFSDKPMFIHPYGSISAVADIYDALSSNRPYRKAHPPEKVIEIMKEMSESHLNRKILTYFFSITPVYPIGTSVRITRGEYINHIGVVASINENKLDRPVLRLIFNPRERPIDPIEIDLLHDEETEIGSIIL